MKPLNPPPSSDVGAFTNPRQLQRWLDVHPVSRLGRVQGYVTVPSTTGVEFEWLGYSDIVASFNFTLDNNFTVDRLVGDIPSDYCMCIMWIDRYHNVYRYKLNSNVGEVFYFDCPDYDGQIIKKNFRIEIWSTPTFDGIVDSLTIYTSILGQFDYRWRDDYSLDDSTVITDFSVDMIPYDGTLPVLSSDGGASLAQWFMASYGISGGTWNPKSSYLNYLSDIKKQGADFTVDAIPELVGLSSITNGNISIGTNNGTFNVRQIWCMFQIRDAVQGLFLIGDLFGSHSNVSILNGQIVVDSNTVTDITAFELNEWVILRLVYYQDVDSNWNCSVGAWSIHEVLEDFSGPSVLCNNPTGNYFWVSSDYVTDIMIYDGVFETSPVNYNQKQLDYFNKQYQNTFNLPFVFPDGSVPELN